MPSKTNSKTQDLTPAEKAARTRAAKKQAAQAEAAKIEAEQAEALKALGLIESEIEQERAGIAEKSAEIGNGWVRVGVLLDRGATMIEADPQGIGAEYEGDWRKWATKVVPERSGPRLYSLRNTGTVAQVIGDVGGTSTEALVPLYRVLKAAKSDEDRTDAENTVRAIFAEAAEQAPTNRVPEALIRDTLTAHDLGQGTAGDTGDREAAKARAAAKRERAKALVAREEKYESEENRTEAESYLARHLSSFEQAEMVARTGEILAGVIFAEKYGTAVAFSLAKREHGRAKKAATLQRN